mmetsp:Transcript_5955/g.17825  ORF Transcript_5955/g.17825 Transcript_5955/m.17825 type:complete len:488 (-) Transcript_5955:105-1568(-)
MATPDGFVAIPSRDAACAVVHPDPEAAAADAGAVTPRSKWTKEEILAVRRRVTSPAQSISYENTEPLLFVASSGQFLEDETGRRFLDTRNNVAHVGHANSAVADAVARQVRTLNTNTRYLHPNHVKLATRLLDTLPGALAKGHVFFVNSGSEANDLALRLARAHTSRKHTIVVERAYHGHTCEVIGISPYKYKYGTKAVPGSAQPAWVTEVEAPDMYRGRYTGPDAAERYAEQVAEACETADGGVAAFFIESGMSVAGVIIPPSGYLPLAYEAIRKAGGVCVADEVQTGFGRFGEHWWAFQESGVVPDIVTMGKPFGNGMPLAAVVCTAEIGESFAKGPEYFNTFGGNPVCCAAGLAVLDEIDRLDLRASATKVGEHLLAKIDALASTPAGKLIGQARGMGLFIGIEFVEDRHSKVPATIHTSWLCSRLKDHDSILTSVDGAHDNVMVIKPPMVFSIANADTLVAAIGAALQELDRVDLASVKRTPT